VRKPAGVFSYIIEVMEQTILFIDGENFTYKIEEILKSKGVSKDSVDIASLDFNKLFE